MANKFFNKLKQSTSSNNKELKEENERLKIELNKNKDNLLLINRQNEQLDSYKKESERLNNENKILKDSNLTLEKENKRLDKISTFVNFQEFLNNSYVQAVINAPFSAEDKRAFAFMDHLSKYLIKKASSTDIKPLVSVIMPTYNRENIIQKAIDSVISQSYQNWELIIIDDGSSDNTLSLLNDLNDSRIKVISYGENRGHSYARNTGLKESKGDYIMYLDSDNQWDYRYMETMVGAFIELPDADALYSGQLLYNDSEKPYAVRFGAYNKALLHNRNYIDMNCFSHKRHVYEKIGGFDEDLIKLVDWDLILRISNRFKMYSVPVLLSKYYETENINRVTEIPFAYYDNAAKLIERNDFVIDKYDELSRKVSIIIPSFESLKELKECIESIPASDMIDIIIVDNDSSIEVKEYLNAIESDRIKVILNRENYGFTYAVQQGIDVSDNDSDIMLLNNDAVLREGAVEHLQMGAYSYEDCGLIVPHEIISENNPHMNLHVPHAEPRFKCDVTPSKNHHNIKDIALFHDGGLLELNFAPFFCVYIKRDVYDRTLGLDPELGRHYRSDRIFSDFVTQILGLRIYQEPNAYVYHKHQASTNALRKNKSDFEVMFFKNQWPDDLAKEFGYKKALWDD